MVYNNLSSNNFYGSWENTKEEFHKTSLIPNDNNFHQVIDSFRIVGNPREEQRYFGARLKNYKPDTTRINGIINYIKSDKPWIAQIEKKAKINNISVDEQLYLDAMWIIDDERKKGEENNRWKRNPRTGNYSFLIVVTDEKGEKDIPASVKNIGVKDNTINNFLNPYYYYFSSASALPEEIYIEKSKKVLRTKAVLNPSKGIYVNLLKYKIQNADTSYFNRSCGNSEKLFYGAHFEQFFHNINKNYVLKNIPEVYNVVKKNYTREQYEENMSKYGNEGRSDSFVTITNSPAKTVGWSKFKKAIYIKNPGDKKMDKPVKENVGVNTRIGFTYGKYRAKIKFPKLLSNSGVWNGVTCAFWLLYQDEAEWNDRSICKDSGYIPKYEVGKTDHRVMTTSYSEIDIEIVKTTQYWPKSYYIGNPNPPSDEPGKNKNLVVACTNWDLACKEPSKFNIFVRNSVVDGKSFDLFRWDQWYKALTIKYSDDQDNIVGDYIYYEIDWQPDRIIWRIGKSKDNMTEIGYMDSTSTKIPDNQMIAVISQEFHDASWWPVAPWDQNFIPFPKNDIYGYIYELEIE